MDSEILKKFHGQKTWRSDPFTSIVDIELRELYDDGDEFQYAVFNLPYCHLRPGATSFCDVKQNGKSLAFKDTFLLFLRLIQMTSENGMDPRGMECVNFIETVQHNNVSIGARIWFFSNRKKTQMHLNLINLVQENEKEYVKLQAKTPKQQVKLSSFQGYLKCKSLHTYLNFASHYTNNEMFLKDVEDIHKQITNPESAISPASIFSVNSEGFTYNFDGMDADNFPQNDPGNYLQNGRFTFPNEKLVLRVYPEQVTIEELFLKEKYLPSYFFEKVRLPSIKVFNDDNFERRRIKVPDHIHMHKKHNNQAIIDFLKQHRIDNNQPNSRIFHYTYETFETFVKPVLRKAFVLSFVNESQDSPTYREDGVLKFLRYNSKYEPKAELSDQWFTDVLTDMKKDPGTRHLLADKFSLDTLDMMRYKWNLLEEYHLNDRRGFQNQMMDEFMQTVVKDVNANVSEPMQSMLHWLNNSYDSKLDMKRRKTDPNGSLFLNSIAWKLNFMEEDLQVSTGHPTLMLLQHSKYDAYRQQLNLHVNLIFTGEGATSKSFLFDKMKQMSIPNTVTELTYQTKRSNAVDKDQNDQIVIFNEAPAGLFMSNNGKDGDKEQEATFKEKLTSQITKCLTWCEDEETGLRANRNVISQSISVYAGATNDDPSAASEAMVTRFYWGQFEKVESKSKTIAMCMQGEKQWKQLGTSSLNKSLHFFHLEHVQMALLFKLMFVGILKYPTLDVSDFIYSRICTSMTQQGYTPGTRFKERFDNMCIIFTMCNALDTVYNYEGGIHYGKPFDARTLIDLEPYLYCTEEIAIFCFTLLSNEVYNPSETKIIKALWTMWKSGGTEYKRDVSAEGQPVVSYDFIKINKTGKKLWTAIQQTIPNHEGKPSEYNIKAIIRKWKDKTYKNYAMVHASNLTNPQDKTYLDNYPQPDPEGKRRNAQQQKDGCVEDAADTYFNIKLFHKLRKGLDYDPIKTAIENCMHKHTVKKKVIWGCPKRVNGVIQYPSVFTTCHMKPSRKEFKRANPLYKNRASLLLRQNQGEQLLTEEKYKGEILKTDLDRWGCLQHAKALQIPPGELSAFFRKYCHEIVEQDMKCHEQHLCINYPDDVINGYKARDANGQDAYVDTFEGFDFEGLVAEERVKRVRTS